MGRSNGDRAVKKCLLIKLEVFKIFNKLRVEKFIKEVRSNLGSKESELINAFVNLKNFSLPEGANVLIINTTFSYDTGFYLSVNEDMFDEVVRVSGDNVYTYGVDLVDDFILYSRDKIGFVNFYDENDLEEVVMKEVSQWIKSCFDLAQVTLPLPIYFRYPDEEDALNLVTGKWEDQMEIEL